MDFSTVRVDDDDVINTLNKLEALLSPAGLSVFLGTTMGPYLSRRARDRFRTEGDDVTGPWAPLKPATIGIREEQGFGPGPINRRTGELENWVVDGGWSAYPTAVGGSMRYPKSKPTGELKKKMETAQSGKKYPSTVKRPVLGVNETDLIFFQTSLTLAVETAMR